jgi:hypothetical protein
MYDLGRYMSLIIQPFLIVPLLNNCPLCFIHRRRDETIIPKKALSQHSQILSSCQDHDKYVVDVDPSIL